MVTNNQEEKRREGRFKGGTKNKYTPSAKEDKTRHFTFELICVNG